MCRWPPDRDPIRIGCLLESSAARYRLAIGVLAAKRNSCSSVTEGALQFAMKPGMGDDLGEDQQQRTDGGCQLHPTLAALLGRERLQAPRSRRVLPDSV